MINNQLILQFCKLFSEKYKINKEEVEDVWKQFCVEKKEIKNISIGCPYKWIKGQKAGQICGTKSKHGLYCSTHKKYENTEQRQRNIVPVCARTELAKKKQENNIEKDVKSNEVKVQNRTTFRKNKELNLYINTTNNFAFSSVKDKIIVGKIVDNKLVKLNEEDKEECERLCLKYN